MIRSFNCQFEHVVIDLSLSWRYLPEGWGKQVFPVPRCLSLFVVVIMTPSDNSEDFIYLVSNPPGKPLRTVDQPSVS